MKVLKLDEYNSRKYVELEEFSMSECEKNVRQTTNCEWVEDFDEDDEENNFNSGEFGSVREFKDLNLIVVRYSIFCMEEGRIEVECEFVNVS